MPYSNFPKDISTAKIDSCVNKVMAKGNAKPAAIAICYNALVKGKAAKEWEETVKEFYPPHDLWSIFKEMFTEKQGARHSATDREHLQQAHDHLVDAGAVCTVQKQADGHYRWVLVSSSSFIDRDKEIVSQQALEEDTRRMNDAKDFGILDWWHTPIKLGTCDFSAMHGLLSVESGTFDDDHIAQKLAEHSKELAVSRSFRHSIAEPVNGIYTNINTFARALLPRGKESNLFTQVEVTQEKAMLQDKIKELIAKLGGDQQAEEKVNALLAQAEGKEKEAVTAGIAHKEETPKPEPEAAPEKPAWFLADMKPEEFVNLVAQGVQRALEPTLAEIKQLKEAQATAVKESGQVIVGEVAKVANTQVMLSERLKALEGLTPRGFRASQAVETEVSAEKAGKVAPQPDPLASFINNMILGQPQQVKP